ncbi:hypothetical protein FOC1_g10011141 [Fusarium oxysporum f. sp. cubense race 1]|uniref:Uncharacterized protein n=1 Tax=Fusarium oxysporum f. sp. cubense (strain race 1) TaxID=1229664 RepID=N4UYH7_FUSC1|nr:hypothetical protein FOC1_g10011141 [Fusarium oxysporum f. sp. cubense race 1]
MLIPLIRLPISARSEETNSSFVCATLTHPSIHWNPPLSCRDEKAFRAAIDSRND